MFYRAVGTVFIASVKTLTYNTIKILLYKMFLQLVRFCSSRLHDFSVTFPRHKFFT